MYSSTNLFDDKNQRMDCAFIKSRPSVPSVIRWTMWLFDVFHNPLKSDKMSANIQQYLAFVIQSAFLPGFNDFAEVTGIYQLWLAVPETWHLDGHVIFFTATTHFELWPSTWNKIPAKKNNVNKKINQSLICMLKKTPKTSTHNLCYKICSMESVWNP